MSFERHSGPASDALNARELAVLECYAEGLAEPEIAVRIGVSRHQLSVIREVAASKLTVRISSAHPFHIREVVLKESLDSCAL